MIELISRHVSTLPLDGEILNPEALAGKTVAEIERILLRHGNRLEALAEHFQVARHAGDPLELRLLGPTDHLQNLGWAMNRGTIHVEGNLGRHCGARMSGGRIEIHGSAGDWLGAEMGGGRIHVHGSAGDMAGCAYRGARMGMRGGEIHITGNAGSEVAGTMRRGLVLVEGACGDFAGTNMIAGTVVVLGALGDHAGTGMKRGTLVTFQEPHQAPGFLLTCRYTPLALPVLLRKLKTFPLLSISQDRLDTRAEVNLYRGDLMTGGRGEIWMLFQP
jgi:formylmethanofuran dehydrogenase subunit C